eukprot:356496-Chlamydomonas_euryale.AAC.6
MPGGGGECASASDLAAVPCVKPVWPHTHVVGGFSGWCGGTHCAPSVGRHVMHCLPVGRTCTQ